MIPLIGRTLAHFEITAKLGAGGMGEVYRATDTKLGREVALKVLPEAFVADPERLARFEREAKTVARLSHPHIVTIHSVEEEEGVHFLTMELIEGKRLSELIPSGGLGLADLFRIAIPLADAVSSAHRQGITHRDLKPENVMVTEEGHVKVLDFGLAKLTDLGAAEGGESPTATITGEGRLLGSLAYMSPEQAEGRPVDSRSDIFSLGILFYEMATGRRPFAGDTNLATLTAILRDTPASATDLRPELPTHFGRVLRRCLQKDPDDRYQTALDVANELRELRDEVRTAAISGVGGGATRERSGRLPRWPLAVAVVVALAGGTYLLTRSPGPEAPAPAQTLEPRDGSGLAILPFTVRGADEFAYLGEGIVDLLATKVDGAGDLRSVDPHALLGFVSRQTETVVDQELAQRAARRFDAGLYLVGDIVAVAGQLHVSAALYEVDRSEPVSRGSVEGPASDIFRLVDDLAAQLVTEQLSGAGAGFTRIAALTTNSLPALKSYLQAESEMRAGQFTSALETFQSTVELDPEFALAWYRLSVAAEWSIRNDLVESAAAEAVRFSDRLSPRSQALLDARLVSRRGEPEKAERLYRAILRSYPEDVEAWSQLAEVLSHYSFATGRSMSESREAWERVLELEPEMASGHWHLARVAAVEGRREDLVELVERVLELNPEGERALELLALKAFTGTDRGEQQAVLAGLEGVNDTIATTVAWNLVIATDNPEAALEVSEELLRANRPDEVRGLGYSIRAYLEAAVGRWAAAREALDAVERLLPHKGLMHRGLLFALPFFEVPTEELERVRDSLESWDAAEVPPSSIASFYFSTDDGRYPEIRLYLLGAVSARLGDPAALGYADQLDALKVTSESQRLPVANLAHGVRGLWWHSRGEAELALAELEGMSSRAASYQDVFASPFISQPVERFLRGELLAAVGREKEALAALSTFSEVSFYDELFVAPASLHRAEIHERQGRPSEAAVDYRKFLKLWRGADPQLRSWLERAEVGLARAVASAEDAAQPR